MATLLLSAVGAAAGAGFGGTVLGLSGAVIGRAIGATLGRVIDQRVLGAGSDPVDIGRVDRLRLTGASEGTPIAKVWGRMRIGGHLIWTTQFQENVRRGGGSKGSQPSTREFSYSISFALGLCEGRILRVGRVWADGEELAPDSLAMRVYPGSEDQLPDPRIEAVEGAGRAPAYRGLAYVVIEDLDLTPFGNRIPQLTFEVIRDADGNDAAISYLVKAVALIPGTGEYALATTPVHRVEGPGRKVALNVNSASGKTDFATSLTQLSGELPGCASVSVVVSWFGSDLRCNFCEIRPKVEQATVDPGNMPWRSGGISRAQAMEVPRVADRPVYGGTPADMSVIEAIHAIRDSGKEVMFYPFILMDQLEGNSLADPYTQNVGQPSLPWRGRITTSAAPGRPGTPDGTAAADAEVALFFGLAQASDFVASGSTVTYAGPPDWGFRRFILHYAHLCAIAGGVDAFCIGSELRGVTQIRGAGGTFPAVAALRALASDVRGILGPACKISYAADWTEYSSYQADGNLYFPLDALWSDPEIDFVGIDNYMPLSDWRDGLDHADSGFASIYNLEYLVGNVAGGEGFDWFYDSPEGEAAQNRRPIEDGAFAEPWVFRVKDLRSWWQNTHHGRTGSQRDVTATAWVPGSKPIRFTEYGCSAIDKGTNQPNRFLDLRSSESLLPRGSNGRRDDLIQILYLKAIAEYWSNPANNPEAISYSGRMIDMNRAHVWAWDARPFPEYPGRSDLWSDATAYRRGHWLNGRTGNQVLSAVVREIVEDAAPGATEWLNVNTLHGMVRGYVRDQVQSARATIQPLMLTLGFDALERDGNLRFQTRLPANGVPLDPALLAIGAEGDGLQQFTRAPEVEGSAIIRLGHVDPEGAFEYRAAEARYPDESYRSVAASEFPIALTIGEALDIAERWLVEARVARDAVRLDLPPSRRSVGPGDLLRLSDGGLYRVDRLEVGETRRLDAVRVESGIYSTADRADDPTSMRAFVAPVPVSSIFLDLPLLTGQEIPHAPHIAVAATPWPGSVSVWSSPDTTDFELNRLVAAPAIIGRTESELPFSRGSVKDRGAPLRVRLSNGTLSSVSELSVLNGANLMAIGNEVDDRWELIQFADAVLVAPDTYEISNRIRGQAGTDGVMPQNWPSGSTVVLVDRALVQIDLAASARSLARNYRIGATSRGVTDPLVVAQTRAFDGVGLRPYPVGHLRASGSSGAPVLATWIRRTRIDGDSWAQTEVPLAEDEERYLVRISSGSTIIATYEVTSSSFVYSQAAQASDGAIGAFKIEVAQVSLRYGAGPSRFVEVPA